MDNFTSSLLNPSRKTIVTLKFLTGLLVLGFIFYEPKGILYYSIIMCFHFYTGFQLIKDNQNIRKVLYWIGIILSTLLCLLILVGFDKSKLYLILFEISLLICLAYVTFYDLRLLMYHTYHKKN